MTDIFEAFLKPKSNWRQSENVYQDSIKIAMPHEDSDYFTRVKVFIKPPTLQYPNPALFLQVANGKGSCFARVSMGDLAELGQFLHQVLTEVSPIMEDMELQATNLQGLSNVAQMLPSYDQDGENPVEVLQQIQALQNFLTQSQIKTPFVDRMTGEIKREGEDTNGDDQQSSIDQ